MYITRTKIRNIRAITEFAMDFSKQPAGWHVLIGDNGAGKSSIIRSIALALIGKEQAYGIRPNWNEWLQLGQDSGSITVETSADPHLDEIQGQELQVTFSRSGTDVIEGFKGEYSNNSKGAMGSFSAGFGPFRRFTGGDKSYERIFNTNSLNRLSSHLSLFGEDVALTEATEWLMKKKYQVLESNTGVNTFNAIQRFINSPDFLPNGVQLTNIGSEGVIFNDANGAEISINQMSDGFRSVLSLTFELIRQLTKSYPEELVFKEIYNKNMVIDLPGVVLVDEVDAHLHPSWQTRIGQWFLKYFPNMQFIVTSHSPLVCRACEKGTIWRLGAPGSATLGGEVTGKDRERLIFGNILDAYGTDVFGDNVSISVESNEKLKEMAELNIKSMMGKISHVEEIKLEELKTILPTATNPLTK